MANLGTLMVRHAPASAAFVRHEICDDLTQLGVADEAIDGVLLVASELVGNAVRHTAVTDDGTIDVSWELDDRGVRVQVADGSPVLPRARQAGARDAGGRGLTIIDAISDDWGVDRTPHGKCVWAHVPLSN